MHVPHKKGDKKEDDNIFALKISVLGGEVVVPFKGYKNEVCVSVRLSVCVCVYV